jgi:hypothetical protein
LVETSSCQTGLLFTIPDNISFVYSGCRHWRKWYAWRWMIFTADRDWFNSYEVDYLATVAVCLLVLNSVIEGCEQQISFSECFFSETRICSWLMLTSIKV